MYAVFQTGSKQYRVVEGQVIHIERIDLEVGNQVEFNQILLIDSNECLHIGSPFIKKGRIIAEIIAQSLNQKIKIIKFRRRKHFRKFQGHRQCFTTIKIVSIKHKH
ncbi:50S ribosomal subunit protein L21 [Candidatus Blochmanniella pennsylvanica str. BPEN]|uniref:Large ribosomal subunit protein bL21 n=1 Tax=Blochmanniella pennsylvanica (strain BPEN) TaxID=291272 RepID=RL21_BLOPB|nr:50S ribosomal protein L21 [Candidatus Blochmannia pennsylvanicus]Q493U7.1 RecName: Full=Large ribosomal subunit protein bL21; AltName: Full=50S ribosomal protein L21 [Candidatus Blochmannia pennsylvanicus str. BPEN]AAZ40738.1 50S ribosomal subunit protein L21 [Candidatus Blochmannia pennsylvanicus str. BPEN]UOY04521.1 50S ribosomal protein L21 [Candidatus Blochmannia pennsylvanicus]